MQEALNRIARIKYMSAKLTPGGGIYWPVHTEPFLVRPVRRTD